MTMHKSVMHDNCLLLHLFTKCFLLSHQCSYPNIQSQLHLWVDKKVLLNNYFPVPKRNKLTWHCTHKICHIKTGMFCKCLKHLAICQDIMLTCTSKLVCMSLNWVFACIQEIQNCFYMAERN